MWRYVGSSDSRPVEGSANPEFCPLIWTRVRVSVEICFT
jgi:hypothetical protein